MIGFGGGSLGGSILIQRILHIVSLYHSSNTGVPPIHGTGSMVMRASSVEVKILIRVEIRFGGHF